MKTVTALILSSALGLLAPTLAANCNKDCADQIALTNADAAALQRTCLEDCFSSCVGQTHLLYYQCLAETRDGLLCEQFYGNYFKICLVSEEGIIDYYWMI